MSNKCSHDTYYGQFVTGKVIEELVTMMTVERIKSSTDEHMNDIPLKHWDSLRLPQDSYTLLMEADKCGGSPSDKVCIFKAGARQIQKDANQY